jgi:Kinesin motor domain
VRVAVRCRPMSGKEDQMGCKSCIAIQGSTVTVTPPPEEGDDRGREAKSFTFDYAFGDDSTQALVYKSLGAPVVEKALQGYNVTIFAYGQTGSGYVSLILGSTICLTVQSSRACICHSRIHFLQFSCIMVL